MKEHIQHFDSEHLKIAASKAGFDMLDKKHGSHCIMSQEIDMPNLYMIFKAVSSERILCDASYKMLATQTKEYVAQELEKQSEISEKILEFKEKEVPVYVWGIGREFLYLYESCGLKECNIQGLIDTNQFKRENTTVDGIKIVGSDIVKEIPDDAVVMITAIAYTDVIEKTINKLGFMGKIIDVNK